MQTVTLSIRGMTCGHCVANVRRALESLSGVAVRDVRIGSAEIALTDPTALEVVVAAVRDAGYETTISSTSNAGIPDETASIAGSCCTPSPVSRLNGDRTGSTIVTGSQSAAGASCH